MPRGSAPVSSIPRWKERSLSAGFSRAIVTPGSQGSGDGAHVAWLLRGSFPHHRSPPLPLVPVHPYVGSSSCATRFFLTSPLLLQESNGLCFGRRSYLRGSPAALRF